MSQQSSRKKHDKQNNQCKNVLPYLQHTGTCWFNAILMATLFSERSRNMLLQKFKANIKTPPSIENGTFVIKEERDFHYLVKYILKYKIFKSKNKHKDLEFHDVFRPENILKGLHTIYPRFVKNDYSNGYYPDQFIFRFYEFLHTTAKMFFITKGKKLYNDMYQYSFLKNNTSSYFDFDFTSQDQSNENPDVLIIHLDKNLDKLYDIIYRNLEINADESYNQLLNLEESIIYNGYKYNMDSMIISNFNESDDNHVVAGIKCNSKKYFYNGWTKTPKDTTNMDSLFPCDLIEFDWDVHIKEKICIDEINCTLPNPESYDDPHNLCFSFAKGSRVIIYIREDISDKTMLPKLSYKPYGYYDPLASIDSDIEKYIHSQTSDTRSIQYICSTSSLSTKARKNKCFDYQELLDYLETVDENKCFDEINKIRLGKYLFQLQEYFDVQDNDIMTYVPLITDTETNTQFTLTVQIHMQDISKIVEISKDLSKIVENDKNPHFLLFYKTYSCESEQTFKTFYKFKTLTNMNLMIFEKIDGFFDDIIDDLNDETILNIVTQAIFCIYSFHNYSKCMLTDKSNNHSQKLVYQKIENDENEYILYRIDNKSYYLKSSGYLIQTSICKPPVPIDKKDNQGIIYDYQKMLSNILHRKNIMGINKIIQFFSNRNVYVQYKNSNKLDDSFFYTLLHHEYLQLFTEELLPANAIIINEEYHLK